MVGHLKCRSRPYYFRQCKKVRPTTTTTSIECLPDELLFLIFVCLPAHNLYDGARLVCRRWYHIIHSRSFINAHLQHSTYGLLFYICPYYKKDHHPILVTATQRGSPIQTYEFSARTTTKILGTCNGLTMELNCQKDSYHIINPTTKQAFNLPSFSYHRHNVDASRIGIGIAYAAASMEYKAVMYYRALPLSLRNLAILTIGVDNSWRQVRVDHLSEHARKLFIHRPLIIEGFMYWVDNIHGREKTVLTLDVETEILTVSEAPILLNHFTEKPKYFPYYLSTGRSLSLLLEIDPENYLLELWEMNPETKEWIKLADDIGLGAQKGRIEQLSNDHTYLVTPVGWVNYPQVLALFYHGGGGGGGCIFYNLDTHEVNLIRLPRWAFLYSPTVYRNSLTWLT